MNPNMAVGSSPGLDVTMALGGKQATNIHPFLTALHSSELPLSTAHKPFRLCLPFHHHDIGTHLTSATRQWTVLWALREGWTKRTGCPVGIFCLPEPGMLFYWKKFLSALGVATLNSVQKSK